MALSSKQRCDLMLSLLFPKQPDLQERWWRGANKAFNGMTPLEAFDRTPDEVVKYLFRHTMNYGGS